MATFSTVLGLKINDEADPFQLSDFTANWELLDASPGTYICTSTSRPNWGSGQAGRLIFMTDLKQTSYWDGAAWNDERASVPTFAGGSYINTSIRPGSSATFNVVTFTTPRPSALAVILAGTYNCQNNATQDAYQSITVDGVQQMMGSYREQIRFVGLDWDSWDTAGANATSLAVVPSISAGQHTMGVKVDVSGRYGEGLTLIGVKILGFVSLYSAYNAL